MVANNAERLGMEGLGVQVDIDATLLPPTGATRASSPPPPLAPPTSLATPSPQTQPVNIPRHTDDITTSDGYNHLVQILSVLENLYDPNPNRNPQPQQQQQQQQTTVSQEIDARDAVEMADPFEVRMRFSGQLQHLNASVVMAQKAAQYALKYKDMSEDLHSCILEQIEKTSMNTRANIMYFIEHFLELAEKERNEDYVRMMQRDIIRVVDAVCPEDRSGAANVKVVRKVLQGLNTKGFLPDAQVSEIEECLKDRDTSYTDMDQLSPANEDAPDAATAAGDSSNGPLSAQKSARSAAAPAKLEKRQIEQRIEEDRERHKKLRENMWQVPRDEHEAMWKFYDDTSDLGEDDLVMAREEHEEYEKCMLSQKQHRGQAIGKGH